MIFAGVPLCFGCDKKKVEYIFGPTLYNFSITARQISPKETDRCF